MRAEMSKAMEKITVVLAPEQTRTRLLVLNGEHDIMKAILGPASQGHRRAVRTLLEGLSLWQQQTLSVVLHVDDPFDGHALGLCDALGFGERNLHYEVGIALPRTRRSIRGIGDFGDLRRVEVAAVVR